MALDKDIKRFTSSLRKLGVSFNDRRINIRLARKCREIIYRRVKSGWGVTHDGSADLVEKKRLDPLSSSYVDYRKGLVIFRTGRHGQVYPIYNGYYNAKGKRVKIKAPKLGPFGKPSKSNLTLTGQMLEAMVISADDRGFKLVIANTSRRNPDGTASKLTNAKVAQLVADNGRVFMALTAGELRILTREMQTIVREEIKKRVRVR